MRPPLFSSAALFAGASLLALASGEADAAFVAPTNWSIGDAGSTYQEWEMFSSATGPNAPNAAGAVTADAYNPYGVANAFDAGGPGNSFVTSGGNIYSFSDVIHARIDVPNAADVAATWTTVLLNVRTQGTAPDASTFTLSDGETDYAPADIVITDSLSLGGMGGAMVDYWLQWVVPGNAASYTITFDALASSMSLDRVRVDTIFTTGANAVAETAPVVPEPASLALVGAGVAFITARRRRP